jgi:hypothetical protein
LLHTHRFRARIEINKINPYVRVSALLASQLSQGSRKPIPVQMRVNGKPEIPLRTNLMPVGDGSFYLYLNGAVRKASGTKVGNMANLEMTFDAAYKTGPLHPVPGYLRDALAKHQKAKRGWSRLAPSLKKEILRYFSRLKSVEAQTRNRNRAIFVLSGRRGRFLGRSWNE